MNRIFPLLLCALLICIFDLERSHMSDRTFFAVLFVLFYLVSVFAGLPDSFSLVPFFEELWNGLA
jgi:hypothetical protein